MPINVTELKPGVTVEIDNNLFRVTEYNHIKVAQQACVRTKMKNLRTGSTIERTFNVSERIETAHIERKNMQFLYHGDDEYNFMDQESFEQMTIPAKVLGNAKNYIKEGETIAIMFYGEEPIDVDLPTAVILKVVETAPGYKGDTVSGTKPATMETGLVVNVPFFVNENDKIKVDTRSGSYIERA